MHNYSAVRVAVRVTPDLLVFLLAGFIAQHGIKLSLCVAMQFSLIWSGNAKRQRDLNIRATMYTAIFVENQVMADMI